MNSPYKFKKTLLALTITLASQQALAAGYQVNAQSATGIGRAFAGDAVIADNASVMARNPAAMSLFDKTSISLGFTSITSKIKIKDATYSNALGYSSSANVNDAGDTAIAPNFYLIVPINKQFTWGMSAYTNFGTKSEFPDDYAASEYGGLTDVKSFNFGLSGSYRFNEQWSVGAGLDLIYGEGKMRRTTSSSLSPIGYGNLEALNVDANGWALGFNLGTVFELDKNNRFGLSYHYSPTLDADGDVNYMGSGKGKLDDTLVMPLPDMLEFSGYHRLSETKFAVHYSIQWTGWSEFDILEAKKSGKLNDYEWQNGIHYSIGGTYYLNQDWTLRAGYMYDTSAQDDITSISVPDSARNWFSTGFTYQLSSQSNVDFGFTYLIGEDVRVHEDMGPISQIDATTRADAILVGLQYSRSF